MNRFRRISTMLPVLLLGLALPSCKQAMELPEDISTHGGGIDHLFWLIMVLTGIAFVVTEFLLVYAVFRFHHTEGRKAEHVHGHHLVEMVWTIVPGIILFFLAIYQISAWTKAKIDIPADDDPNVVVVRVLARQFEWAFQYAGPDGKFDTADDPYSLSNFVVPVHTKIKLHLRSRDVLHSFFLPNLRFKQDLLPGKDIGQWFEATKTTAHARAKRSLRPGWRNFNYEVACAELCGLGHQKMRAVLTILSKDAFKEWLVTQSAKYNTETGDLDPPPAFAEEGGWRAALTTDDPTHGYRQAAPGEPGFHPIQHHKSN